MVIWPYVALPSRYEAAQALIANAEQKTVVVTELQAILTAGVISVRARTDDRMKTFVADLRHDMDGLDRIVNRIRSESPISAGLQRSGSVPSASGDPFSTTDADLTARIRDAADVHQLRDAVQPVVVTEIVAPAFDALNRFWTDTVVVELNDQLNTAETRLSDM